jgi:hypothetical protein
MKLLGALFAVLVSLAGCASVPKVPLTSEWPAQAGSYDSVTRDFTRSTSLSAGYQQVLSVDATLLSPLWRAARAVRDAELRGLGTAARDELLAKAKQDAAGNWAIMVIMTTWDRSENDLHRGKRATWKAALLDEQGNEIAPVTIERDRRPEYMVKADFPHYGDFAQAYTVTFPKEKPVLGPSVRQVRLRLASVRGSVELVWQSP